MIGIIFFTWLCITLTLSTFLPFYLSKGKRLQVKYDTSIWNLYPLLVTLFNGLLQAIIMEFSLKDIVFSNTYNIIDMIFIYIHFVTMFVLQDTYFYWMHRLSHRSRLYRYVHKMHHAYSQPGPFTSYYENLVDHLFIWTVPYIVFPFIFNLHIVTYYIFILFTTTLSIEGHTGYDLKGFYWYIGYIFNKAPRIKSYIFAHNLMHDYHHQNYNCNFGLWFTIWDRICNTLTVNYDQYVDDKLN
jgi:lathosterol oxidase